MRLVFPEEFGPRSRVTRPSFIGSRQVSSPHALKFSNRSSVNIRSDLLIECVHLRCSVDLPYIDKSLPPGHLKQLGPLFKILII
jgi:hypothetical protein